MALLDPMCGAGTFLSEAAEIALGRAPGRERDFGFEKLARFDAAAWERMRRQRAQAERAAEPLPIFGSRPLRALARPRGVNLREAGLEDAVRSKQANLLELSAPAATRASSSPTRPTACAWARRNSSPSSIPSWATLLKQRFAGWTAFIFSGDPELAQAHPPEALAQDACSTTARSSAGSTSTAWWPAGTARP